MTKWKKLRLKVTLVIKIIGIWVIAESIAKLKVMI